MLFAIIFLHLSSVQIEPIEPVGSTMVSRGYPNALAEPVEKYSICISEKTNAAMASGVQKGEQVRLIYRKARSDCDEVRRSSFEAGKKILRQKGVSNEKARASTVEDALSTIDEHGDSFAVFVDRSNAPEVVAARRKAMNAQD